MAIHVLRNRWHREQVEQKFYVSIGRQDLHIPLNTQEPRSSLNHIQ